MKHPVLARVLQVASTAIVAVYDAQLVADIGWNAAPILLWSLVYLGAIWVVLPAAAKASRHDG